MRAGIKQGLRNLSFGRRTKISNVTPNYPAEVVSSAQALRTALQTQRQSGIIENIPTESLISLANSVNNAPKDSKIPESVFRLIAQTLDHTPNYKGQLSVENLQLVFRAVASQLSQLDLVTRLYLDVYRHSKISPSDRLENGLYYYVLLRHNGHLSKSAQLVGALLKDNAIAVDETFVSKLLDVTADTQPDAQSYVAIIEAWHDTKPSAAVLTKAISLISKAGSSDGLNRLALHLYFKNPHFDIPSEVPIMLLDAFLQLPANSVTETGANGGEKVLQICLAKRDQNTPLEVLELLLMSCIHFQEPVHTGNAIVEDMRNNWSATADYTKETWDVLCQWAVYKAESPLQSLKDEVLSQMPPDYVDATTLHGVLMTTSDKAQCNEAQIRELVDYFEQELNTSPDSVATAILMRRALQSLEVDRARQLFIDSNTDWNAIDNHDHTKVLSDLLIAMCRTPSIPRQTVMDTYQRVDVFVRPLRYEAQIALLKMFLEESNGESTPAGLFLIDQFGEQPNLRFEDYREIYDLFYQQIMTCADDTKAWNLFGILNCTIKLPYESYYPLQQRFCDLGRPDVAHVMFRHLRRRVKAAEGIRPPGPEMYTMLFAQYAKWRYEEGVHELDTYFRMDLNNEMTPSILNRMLAAYSSLEDGHKIANLWSEALNLPRGGIYGPNNETMTIMLHYFSGALGLDAVDELWAEIPTRFGLLPTADNLKQYVIANCYHGYYMRALEIVKGAPETYKIPVNEEILQALYNWTLLPQRKNHVREYALENYSEQWKKLESTPGALKEVILPSIDSVGEYDEQSRRLEAIRQLEQDERRLVIQQ